MKTLLLIVIAMGLFISVVVSCSGVAGTNASTTSTRVSTTPPKKRMRPFQSDQELTDYLHKLAQRQQRERSVTASNDAQPASPAAELAKKEAAEKDDSVTNVQHAGVDEGGIVKLRGNQLVVLRRGRLFTVAIGDGALKPVSVVDAFGPDIDPRYTWYDEMLLAEDTIAVIGYSYERGGTEVGLFNIDDQGRLSYRSTYHLRSNDYYSSRNYASRLIGSKLIFYSPLYIDPGASDPFQSFPAVRKWHKGASQGEFQRTVSASRVYRPEQDFSTSYGMALHTVTICDLSNGGFACQATSVLGPPGRVFYVAPDSVYVWVTDWKLSGDRPRTQSMVFRMPLDGSGPSALRVSGSPVDQFSFLESEDNHLNVLVRSEASGDGMWAGESAGGSVSLMRVPVMSFSDGSETVPASSYGRLPTPQGYTFQNRFVGDYLLYGTGSGWGAPQKSKRPSLYVVRFDRGDWNELSLTHGVDRIEQIGSDAVIVGTDGQDLHFSAVRLKFWPEVTFSYTRKDASQGELRSHGFFYKSDGPDSGTLGLPISVARRPGYRHLFEGSAAILFLRNESLRFTEVGELYAQSTKVSNDACRASCVDWYGNARPLFVHGRLFALLGYEIVEGTLNNGRIHELRRVNYAPRVNNS